MGVDVITPTAKQVIELLPKFQGRKISFALSYLFNSQSNNKNKTKIGETDKLKSINLLFPIFESTDPSVF